jgi:TIGR00251 family protein
VNKKNDRSQLQSLRLNVKATPRAKRSEVLGIEEDVLRVKLKAPPVEGAANRVLVDLLGEFFQVPKKNIKILRGERSRIKEVEIQGLSKAQAKAAVLRPQKS